MGTPNKILIVEDEGVIAMNLRRKLEKMGFVITRVVDNCEDALRYAAETRPDLVIMDIIIQGDTDGIETAQKLRLQQDVPVVFLTAHSDERTIERAKSALPYGYLVKPFEERELKTTIEMALYRHESQAIQRLQQQAIASATVGIVIADAQDPDRPIVMCNPALEKITGYSFDELKGQSLRFVFGEHGGHEDNKKGRDFLTNDETGVVTITCCRKGGDTYIAEISCSLVRDEAGRDTHHLIIVQDVTVRVTAERLANRTQRMEALGTLVGGIAHDLNNALTPILMGAELLEIQYPEASDTINAFRISATRGAGMVRQLLTFAKGSEGKKVSIQPKHLLNEMGQIMRSTFPKNIRCEIEVTSQVSAFLGDQTLVHQILLNLCVNARDAMPQGGTLTLAAKSIYLDEIQASQIPEADVGHYSVFEVRDTGIGISPDIIDRIFDPFFSTKAPDHGTGLGLSTVAGIVKGHNGFMKVVSQERKGTTIGVYLPSDDVDLVDENEAPAEKHFKGKGELVLLIDDEPTVLRVGYKVLKRLNFKPVTATDGLDGLVQLTEHRAELRVVITDLHMPNMDGKTFVRAFRKVLPDTPVIVSSGNIDEKTRVEFEGLDVWHFLDKPYTEMQLREVMQEVLQKGK